MLANWQKSNELTQLYLEQEELNINISFLLVHLRDNLPLAQGNLCMTMIRFPLVRSILELK